MPVKLKGAPRELGDRLDEAVKQGRNLLAGPDELATARSGYMSWDKRNEQILDSAFETTGFLTASPKHEYLSAVGLRYPFSLDMSENVTIEGIRHDIKKKIERLQLISSRLDVYERAAPDLAPADTVAQGDGVFIIHGHDDVVRLQVENLVHRATAHRPLVLRDLANRGATIIEKLEEHLGRSASFAIVIMTGDDMAVGLDGSQMPRARQNVVLELGFAMARLGRRNVTILYQPGTEMPSDINGVAYWELDSAGAWRANVLGDMSAAGLTVDPRALLP